MKTLRNYHDLYNKSHVLLLSDAFENFRDLCIKNYELDPAWYYAAPGLAWDAALKITVVNLELLSDPDMLLMVEQGIRGGISMIPTPAWAKNTTRTNERNTSLISTRTIFTAGQCADPSQHLV